MECLNQAHGTQFPEGLIPTSQAGEPMIHMVIRADKRCHGVSRIHAGANAVTFHGEIPCCGRPIIRRRQAGSIVKYHTNASIYVVHSTSKCNIADGPGGQAAVGSWLFRPAHRRKTHEALHTAHPGATIPDGRLTQGRMEPDRDNRTTSGGPIDDFTGDSPQPGTPGAERLGSRIVVSDGQRVETRIRPEWSPAEIRERLTREGQRPISHEWTDPYLKWDQVHTLTLDNGTEGAEHERNHQRTGPAVLPRVSGPEHGHPQGTGSRHRAPQSPPPKATGLPNPL